MNWITGTNKNKKDPKKTAKGAVGKTGQKTAEKKTFNVLAAMKDADVQDTEAQFWKRHREMIELIDAQRKMKKKR